MGKDNRVGYRAKLSFADAMPQRYCVFSVHISSEAKVSHGIKSISHSSVFWQKGSKWQDDEMWEIAKNILVL